MVTTKTAVLLALRHGRDYGTGIRDYIWRTSRGRFSVQSGVLYPLLERLALDGLIEEIDGDQVGEGRPRRYYQLTEKGRKVAQQLATDLRRLAAGPSGR